MRSAPSGYRLALRSDDPIATVDVPHAARSAGHACEQVGTNQDEPVVFVITGKGSSAGDAPAKA